MADGGIAMDQSPDPPKIDWSNQIAVVGSEVPNSLSDRLQRLLAIKKPTPNMDSDPFGSTAPELGDDSNYFTKLLAERDEMWREHERSQISFMEREYQRMLLGLHQEIERLQTKCSDLTRQLAETLVATDRLPKANDPDSDAVVLKGQLNSARGELVSLRDVFQRRQEKLAMVERDLAEQRARYEEELERQRKQIDEVKVDLSQKTALIAQLTVQLHQLRLKEAVEKQRCEQRRHMADQQTKRRQALAASASDASLVVASARKAVGHLSKSTPQGREFSRVQSESVPSFQPTRKTVARPTPTAAASDPRRIRSSALPAIMTTSAPITSNSNSVVDEKKKSNSTAIKSFKLSK